MATVFNEEQKAKADFIMASPYAKLSDLLRHELQDLAVVWSYYSGKIEGNTYSYVETESLLKDGITSEKRYEDAKMLKNLYNVFVSEIRYIHELENVETIDEKTLLRLHSAISAELVSSEESGRFRDRSVKITGTGYVPPDNRIDIQIAIAEVLYRQDAISHPLEKAVFLHCNIAKIQPFIDGNKRTSRMVESIVLMNDGIIPVYSTNEADINAYRRGVMSFYETGDYALYADYFLNRQIRRINGLSTRPEERYELEPERKIHPPKQAFSRKLRM